jgi:hypothetical protein
LPPNFAFKFNMRPSAKAPRRAVRPYVVKLTTLSIHSALGVHGLASTSTLGNVHVQVAQGGRASPTYVFRPDCLLIVYQCTCTLSLHPCRVASDYLD